MEDAFERSGLPEAHARQVAQSMIVADLRGVGTHGMIRSGGYIERFRTGLVNPRPEPRLTSTYP